MALPSIGDVIAIKDSAMVVMNYEITYYGSTPEITLRGAFLEDGIQSTSRAQMKRQTSPETGRQLPRNIQLSS